MSDADQHTPPPPQEAGKTRKVCLDHPLALPVGTELVGDYVITRVLGAGGFGITYEARETSLDRMVAIKEYFPADIVQRDGWAMVKPRSRDQDPQYARGLRRFIEEAKAITRFNHPNIVRVLRYFKTNNTAFMVLHFEDGVDLATWRQNLKRPPREDELMQIITPLLDALTLIHGSDYLHRDIAPDNVIIRRDGTPVLIDFGAARSELIFNERTVSALVKPGYSPFEQYARNSKEQGPWTDIYSLGATLYEIITGAAPPDSLSRLARDEMTPLAKKASKRYSPHFIDAIDKALAVKINERPQSVGKWKLLFRPVPEPVATQDKPDEPRPLPAPAPQMEDNHHIYQPVIDGRQLADKAGRLAATLARKVKAPFQGRRVKRRPPRPAAGASGDQGSLLQRLNRVEAANDPAAHEKMIEQVARPPSQRTAILAEGLQLAKHTARKAATRLSSLKLSRLVMTEIAVIAVIIVGMVFWRPQMAPVISDWMQDLQLPKINLLGRGDPQLIRTIAAHDSGVRLLRLSDNERFVISIGAHNRFKTWRAFDGAHHQTTTRNQSTVTAITNANGRLLTADKQGVVTSAPLDAPPSRPSAPTRLQILQGPISAFAIMDKTGEWIIGDPSGGLILAGFEEGVPGEEGVRRHELRGEGHSAAINVITPYKKYFFTGGRDGTLKLWQADRRKLLRTFHGHARAINAIAASERTRQMASASDDGSIRIWSTRRKRPQRILKGHRGPVLSLAMSPDGRWLASGGMDRTIRLWDVKKGQTVHVFTGHKGAVQTLLLHISARQLISGGRDGTIRYWDLDPKPAARTERP